MKNNNFSIKTMDKKQLDIAVEWAAGEGWNPGLHDSDCYYKADPKGFLIGLVDEKPAASISVIKYSESFGFLGFYIVKPQYRGMGYGIKIWNAGLKYLEGRNIGLDGVTAQQENYKKSGFKLAYRNIRYEGCGGGSFTRKYEIVRLSSLPFETVNSYEKCFFPAVRSDFIKSWIAQPDSFSFGIMSGSKLSGYGVIRACRIGYKIGPLYADSPELAETLFLSLKSCISPDKKIFLDIPEVNKSAVSLAEKFNMKVCFETARMYTGKQPEISLDKIFGVTSFEIG
ncbi:MAG: GNAT family N-acetyltransferase [Desulfobacteraceae bacterium]|nr:GNAT family N-acetyltransferase [Desulfobacteraceae bacterium]